MPKFGICCFTEHGEAAKNAGWDYIEESVQNLLMGQTEDRDWDGNKRAAKCPLPIPAANLLVPAALKITGPDANLDSLKHYMTRVLSRAKQLGLHTLVFGSAGARNVPEGFDRKKADEQIVDFLKMAAPIAQANHVTIVIEHLNKGESNIINTPAESLSFLKQVNHPHVQMLLDSYHIWIDEIPLDAIEPTLEHVKHVHLADKDGRVPPGESGSADYRPFFRMLKDAHYNGNISVEALVFDIPKRGADVLKFVKKQWQEA